MNPNIPLILTITPEPYFLAALRPMVNMETKNGWDAFTTRVEAGDPHNNRLFYYNRHSGESSWNQPLDSYMPISTCVRKKKTLSFGDTDDPDFKVDIEYPENEDEWDCPTEDYNHEPHKRYPYDGYVSDPDIEDFLRTQQHLQTQPYSNQMAFTVKGSGSLGPHPLSEKVNQEIRDRPRLDPNRIFFGLEESKLRWGDTDEEDSPPSRLN